LCIEPVGVPCSPSWYSTQSWSCWLAMFNSCVIDDCRS
tara:strand:+ start:142141 stop:142254 length:114 start_codon:yes stop_codon:yes gene_type:complete